MNLKNIFTNTLNIVRDLIDAKPARIPVESEAIASVGYHRGTLEIEFRSGLVYAYPDVPRSIYERLMAAESKGKFFRAEIRDVYTDFDKL